MTRFVAFHFRRDQHFKAVGKSPCLHSEIIKYNFLVFFISGHLQIPYSDRINVIVDCIEFYVAENIISDTEIKVLTCP